MLMIRNMNSLIVRNRLMSGAVWSIIGSVVASGMSLVALILLAHVLNKQVYGQYITIQTIVTMASLLIGFGSGMVATKVCAEHKLHDPGKLGQLLSAGWNLTALASTVVAIGLFITGPFLAKYYLRDIELQLSMQITLPAIIFMSLDSFNKSALIGFEAMRAFAIGTIAAAMISTVALVIGAYFFGLVGACASLLLGTASQFLFSHWQLHKELRKWKVKKTKADKAARDSIWQFGGPAFLASLAAPATLWALQGLLIHGSASGYSEVAVFGLAVQWYNIMMFLPGTLSRVFLPRLTEHVTLRNSYQSRRMLLLGIASNMVTSLLLLSIVLPSTKLILGLYGPSFVDQNRALVFGVLAAACTSISLPIQNLLLSRGEYWTLAMCNICGWIVAVILMGFMLPPVSDSASLSLLGGQLAVALIMIVYVARFLLHQRSPTNDKIR